MLLESVQRLNETSKNFLHLSINTIGKAFHAVLDASESNFKRREVVVCLDVLIVWARLNYKSLSAFLEPIRKLFQEAAVLEREGLKA